MEAELGDLTVSQSPCLICSAPAQHFFKDNKTEQTYFKCPNCEAVFLAKENRLSLSEETARYELHENNPEDQAYRDFLFQLIEPLLEKLSKFNSPSTLKGLDYGSGPNPTLSVMLKEYGYEVDNYDPIYGPKLQENKIYDFITCTEAAEHFYNPHNEFEKISSILKPGGVFALMTLFLKSDEDFKNWYYRRDPSHVIFYATKTLEFIAQKHFISSKNLCILNQRVAIFVKN